MKSPLPDPNRRHLLQFHVAPNMEYRKRLTLAGLLVAAGLLVQIVSPSTLAAPALVLGAGLVAAGTCLLLVRGYDLRPPRRRANRRWERTTRERFAEVRRLEEQVVRWDESATDITCVSGFFTALMVGGGVLLLAMATAVATDSPFWAVAVAVDGAALLLPHWLTGVRRKWRPAALRQQIEALEKALAVIDRYAEPPCQIQPMFEVAGTSERTTPQNARVFIRFPDGPEDFLGLQFQVAINDVQGTKYPYLYAVLVAKKSFRLLDRHFDQIKRLVTRGERAPSAWNRLLGRTADGRLLVAKSRDKEVDVIVIRQKTTKTSGYHTGPAVIRRIAARAWEAAALAIGASPATGGPEAGAA